MSTLHIYRRKDRGPIWQAQAYLGGKRHRFSCRTADKTTARKYAEQHLKELEARHNRGLRGLPEPVRMSAVFLRYEREYAPKLRTSARQRMMNVVNQARSWFAAPALSDPYVQNVTAVEVQTFLELKLTEGVTARTRNLYRANLRRVFQLCIRPWMLISANPVDGTEPLPHDPKHPVLLSEAEYGTLRAACGNQPMLSLFVTLAWETGARSSELLQLHWQHVDFAQGTLSFINNPEEGTQTKTRRTRIVPLSTEAFLALRHHAAQFRLIAPKSEFVFKHLRRSRSAEPGQRIASVHEGFKSAARRAGISDLSPHHLRHSFITRKLAEGVPVQLVSKYVGHADLATTMTYTHLVADHLRQVVEHGKQRVQTAGS